MQIDFCVCCSLNAQARFLLKHDVNHHLTCHYEDIQPDNLCLCRSQNAKGRFVQYTWAVESAHNYENSMHFLESIGVKDH